MTTPLFLSISVPILILIANIIYTSTRDSKKNYDKRISDAASSANVGATRYRTTANASYCEMVMQTGATTYAWVVIVTNTW